MPWLQKRPLTHVAPGQPGLARPWVAWVRFFPGKCQNVPLGERNRVSVRVFHRSLQHSEVSISIKKFFVDLRLIDADATGSARRADAAANYGEIWMDQCKWIPLLRIWFVFCRELRCSAARGDVVPAAPGRRSGCGSTASAWLPRVSRLSQSRTESSFS